MAQQSQTFSHNRQQNKFKGLAGVSLNGTVTFASDLYPGSVSDKEIVLHSKVPELNVGQVGSQNF